jgi:toxin ParE1/3/4
VTYEVIFTPGAEADLDEIEQYLSVRFSPENAQRFVQRIVACCRSLALAPYRGTKRDDVGSGLRVIGFERRVSILFHVEIGRIVIFGALYRGRQFEMEP